MSDLLLLCSDGLHGQLDDGEVSTILRSNQTIEHIGRDLVAASNRAGGRDNVTVLLISRTE
jgi:protein phosphatase